MDYTRWYDEDEYSRLLMNTLEQTQGEAQTDLASDIVQLIFYNKKNIDLDEIINKINRDYVPQRRRWYDKNEVTLSAVEMMKCMAKLLNLKEKEEILKEFCYSLVSRHQGPSLKFIEGKN